MTQQGYLEIMQLLYPFFLLLRELVVPSGAEGFKSLVLSAIAIVCQIGVPCEVSQHAGARAARVQKHKSDLPVFLTSADFQKITKSGFNIAAAILGDSLVEKLVSPGVLFEGENSATLAEVLCKLDGLIAGS